MRVSVCSFLMIRTASQCGQRTAGDGGAAGDIVDTKQEYTKHVVCKRGSWWVYLDCRQNEVGFVKASAHMAEIRDWRGRSINVARSSGGVIAVANPWDNVISTCIHPCGTGGLTLER
jgi:hypothetical protein